MGGELPRSVLIPNCGIGISVFITNTDGIDKRVKGYGNNPLGGFMGFICATQDWLDTWLTDDAVTNAVCLAFLRCSSRR